MSGDYSWLSHFDLGLNWAVIIKWLPKLAQGATLTLELVAIAVIAGLLLAIPLGIARSSRRWYVSALPYGYIFFFRGTPLLVQLFWCITAWRSSMPCATASCGRTCETRSGAPQPP